MGSKGYRFTLGVWGLRVCSLDVVQPCATARNRSQPVAWGPVGRVYGKFCTGSHFWRFQTSGCFVSRGRRGTSWHSEVFRKVSNVVLCGKRNTFASVLCQVATKCKFRGRCGILWDVMKIDGCSFLCSHASCLESLVFLWPPRVYGGSCETCPFRRFPKVVMLFCVAGAALCDIPTCLITCRKSFFVAGAILLRRFHKMSCSCRGRRSMLEISVVIFVAGAALHTPHFTLYTPHSTLHPLHFTLHTMRTIFPPLHFILYPLHSAFHTPPFTLHPLHSTLHTPHWLYISHFTLCTPHSTLYTLHSKCTRLF